MPTPTKEQLSEWLKDEATVKAVVTGGMQDFSPFKTTRPDDSGLGTYKFYFLGGPKYDETTYKFRADLHYGGDYDGGLGSVWFNSVDGVSFNAQRVAELNSATAAMLQIELRKIVNDKFGTNYPT